MTQEIHELPLMRASMASIGTYRMSQGDDGCDRFSNTNTDTD